jgi:type IV secretion system protein VirB10
MDGYNNKNNSGYDEFEEQAGLGEGASKSPKERFLEAMKQPKNIFILVGTFIFLLVVFIKVISKPKSSVKDSDTAKIDNTNDNNKLPEIANIAPSTFPTASTPVQVLPQKAPEPPPLPSLNLDLFDRLTTKTSSQETDSEDDLNQLDLKKLQAEIERDSKPREEVSPVDQPFETLVGEIAEPQQKIYKTRKANPDAPPPPIFDMVGNMPLPQKKPAKEMSDFIFMDSSLEADLSEEVPNEGRKVKNMGNLVGQGRIIDAVLESAIDSSIPGTIRAIISRNVYAETGRNIIIPKGTRLYGSYSAGGGAERVMIRWNRILRPDGISLSIDSFASDQFGRAGIEGDVDRRWGEIMASAVLLSTIPVVATIASQQISGARTKDVTTTNAVTGLTSRESDPINDATRQFSNELSQATQQIVKGMIDTRTVVRISQGTRIKVMVNQDMVMPKYRPVTAINSTVTGSSQ